MGRDLKRRKLEQQVDRLERDYVSQLAAALRQSRDGRWGLFGQNDHLYRVQSQGDELATLGKSIRSLRSDLGILGAFQPHERFLYYRSLRGPNVPGEPRLAEALLEELGLSPLGL